jgi:hypothetical protein
LLFKKVARDTSRNYKQQKTIRHKQTAQHHQQKMFDSTMSWVSPSLSQPQSQQQQQHTSAFTFPPYSPWSATTTTTAHSSFSSPAWSQTSSSYNSTPVQNAEKIDKISKILMYLKKNFLQYVLPKYSGSHAGHWIVCFWKKNTITHITRKKYPERSALVGIYYVGYIPKAFEKWEDEDTPMVLDEHFIGT